MPLRDLICRSCDFKFEAVVRDGEEMPTCAKCNLAKDVERDGLSLIGGYAINGSNSASVRPKRAGSFRRTK